MAVRITRAGVALTVGIILLTGLIIGGLLWAKSSGEQARREEALQIAEQNLEEQSRQDVALNEGDADADDEKPAEAGTSGQGSGEAAPTIPNGGQGSSSVETLPETGSNDGLVALLAGILTYAGVALYRSRAV